VIWLAPAGAFLCFLVYACKIVPPGMNDLALVEARVVEPVSVPESRNPPQGPGPWLRLTLSSERNLVAMARDSELNSYPMVVDCADRDLGFYAQGPFRRGLHTAIYTDDDDPRYEELRREEAAGYDYQIYIAMRGRLRSEADFNRPMPAYDLGRERRTLCIRLGGGNMLGGFFRSNEVRLTVPPQ
jgi:hypothetical protein